MTNSTSPLYRIAFLVIIGSIFVTSCTKNASDFFEYNQGVEENGLTREINELVSEEILEEMAAQGMPINRGGNPPELNGKFFSSVNTLLNSNVPSDFVGQTFVDYTWNFYDQDNQKLQIMVDYESTADVGMGRGSFIVGEGNGFSVFVENVTTNSEGDKAQTFYCVSGTITDSGIKDFHLAFFMIDNFGNPSGTYIDNGQGRVIYDSDGDTPKI